MMPYTEVENFLNTLISNEEALDKEVLEQGTQLKHNGHRIHVAAFGKNEEWGGAMRMPDHSGLKKLPITPLRNPRPLRLCGEKNFPIPRSSPQQTETLPLCN